MILRLLFALTLLYTLPARAGIIDYAASGVYSSKVVTGNATTTVKSGSGVLHLVITGNASSGGEIKLYDSLTGAGVMILDVIAGTPSGGLLSGSGNQPGLGTGAVDIAFSTGLTVVTSGSANNLFTVVYQ